MTNKRNGKGKPGASGVQHNIPKTIRLPRRVAHGLFFDPRRHYLDQRTRIARIIKNAVEHLLDPFPEPRPAGAILIARQCAYKALRLRAFEHAVLTSQGVPAKTTDEAYLALSNSLTKDVELLHRMAREGKPPVPVPSLQEYLQALKEGRLVVAEGGEEA
jgi:hypothetical protein